MTQPLQESHSLVGIPQGINIQSEKTHYCKINVKIVLWQATRDSQWKQIKYCRKFIIILVTNINASLWMAVRNSLLNLRMKSGSDASSQP